MICPHAYSIPRPNGLGATDRVTIPCGKCPACLTNRREEWSVRLLEEYKDSKYATFVTLTYNDENFPKDFSISKREVQLFIKRLRKFQNVRYYAVGEYGTTTYRPHYHFILFSDHNIEDSVLKAWSKGHVKFGEVNIKSILYVCKYHVNRTSYPDGLSPPFVLMSKKPPLGVGYLKRMYKWHESIDNSYYQLYERKMKLPRYYKNRLYNETKRAKIAEKFKDDRFSPEKFEKYKKRYPKSNYAKYVEDAIKSKENKFREKINYNDKL